MFTCDLHKDSVTVRKRDVTMSKRDHEGGASSDDALLVDDASSSSIDSAASPIPTSPIMYRNTSLRVMIPSKRPFLPPFFSSSCDGSLTRTPER